MKAGTKSKNGTLRGRGDFSNLSKHGRVGTRLDAFFAQNLNFEESKRLLAPIPKCINRGTKFKVQSTNYWHRHFH